MLGVLVFWNDTFVLCSDDGGYGVDHCDQTRSAATVIHTGCVESNDIRCVQVVYYDNFTTAYTYVYTSFVCA